MDGLHQQNNQIAAVEKAEALYVGGGNTFQLLKALYDHNLLDIIRKRVLIDGVPYVGSSAGEQQNIISIITLTLKMFNLVNL